jgi:hypothetical protein
MTRGKLKAGVFTFPQICILMTDTFFENSMNQLGGGGGGIAWQSLKKF